MKQLLVGLICLSLTVNSLAGAGDRYVKNSHQNAKQKAQSYLNQAVMGQLNLLMGEDISARIAELNKSAVEGVELLHAQMELARIIEQQNLGELRGVAAQALDLIYEEYNTRLHSTQDNVDALYGIMISAQELVSRFEEMALSYRSGLAQTCRSGLTFDIASQSLPEVDPLNSNYSVYMSLPLDGPPDANNVAQSNVSLGSSPEDSMKASLLTAGIYIGSLKLLTGNLVLHSGAGFYGAANVSAAALAQAAAMTLAVVAVVIAIVVIASHFENQRMSRKQVKQASKAFHQGATLEDSRGYFQEYCEPLVQSLKNLPEKISSVKAEDPKVVRALGSELSQGLKLIDKFVEAKASYERKKQELATKYPLALDEERHVETIKVEVPHPQNPNLTQFREMSFAEVFDKELSESTESAELQKIADRVDAPTVNKIVEGLFLNFILMGTQALKELQLKIQPALEGVDVNRMKELDLQLLNLVRMQNIRKFEAKFGVNIEKEIAGYKEIADLYFEFDTLILGMADRVIHGTSTPRLQIQSQINSWLKRYRRLRTRFPNSEVLKLLSRHYKILEEQR